MVSRWLLLHCDSGARIPGASFGRSRPVGAPNPYERRYFSISVGPMRPAIKTAPMFDDTAMICAVVRSMLPCCSTSSISYTSDLCEPVTCQYWSGVDSPRSSTADDGTILATEPGSNESTAALLAGDTVTLPVDLSRSTLAMA